MAKASEVCAKCGKTMKDSLFALYENKPYDKDNSICGGCGVQRERDRVSAATSSKAADEKVYSEKAAHIKLLTVETIPAGMEPVGIARGSTARARNAIADFGAGLKNVVGGEVVSYTKLIADAREQALQRLGIDAAKMGADMVVGVRFTSTTVDTGISEILAYGTALKKIDMETEDG